MPRASQPALFANPYLEHDATLQASKHAKASIVPISFTLARVVWGAQRRLRVLILRDVVSEKGSL